MVIVCCDSFNQKVNESCEMHPDGDCPDMFIRYLPRDRNFYINIMNHASYTISFCPFCGTELPSSKSDERYDRLEAMGYSIDQIHDEEIPEDFKTDEWWKKDEK